MVEKWILDFWDFLFGIGLEKPGFLTDWGIPVAEEMILGENPKHDACSL